MTTETTRDYETLEPRALDALVAERVMGREAFVSEWCRVLVFRGVYGDAALVPHYSTDPAAAFTVLEAMRERGYGYTIEGHVAPYVKIWRPGAENARPGTSFRDIAFARAAVIEALRGLDEFEVAG
jgi:hypothetical protein